MPGGVRPRPGGHRAGLVADRRSDGVPAEHRSCVHAPGATALYARYATGRTIERSGRDLDAALDAVVTSWPIPVTSLTLVGHSTGGLLLREACAVALQLGARWVDRLDDRPTGRPVDARWLVGPRHHLVVGRLHPSAGHLVNALLGDALVCSSSATGMGRWRRIAGAAPRRVIAVGASHLRLPRDAEAAEVLAGVLSGGGGRSG